MIKVRDESRDELLVIEAEGKLTQQDYKEIFIPALEKKIESHGKIKVLFFLGEKFNGWEMGAMWEDTKFGAQHRSDFTKIAVVGGPKWVSWGTNLVGHLVSGDVRTFKVDEFDQALEWIKK